MLSSQLLHAIRKGIRTLSISRSYSFSFYLMLDPNNKELIAKQKQLLNKRLGLDVAEGLGITGDEELFKEEDLLTKSEKNVSLTAHVSLTNL